MIEIANVVESVITEDSEDCALKTDASPISYREDICESVVIYLLVEVSLVLLVDPDHIGSLDGGELIRKNAERVAVFNVHKGGVV